MKKAFLVIVVSLFALSSVFSVSLDEIIKGVLKEAILNNVRNLKYIDKIVYEWSKNGVKKKIKEEKSNNELFDYDWLEDNE